MNIFFRNGYEGTCDLLIESASKSWQFSIVKSSQGVSFCVGEILVELSESCISFDSCNYEIEKKGGAFLVDFKECAYRLLSKHKIVSSRWVVSCEDSRNEDCIFVFTGKSIKDLFSLKCLDKSIKGYDFVGKYRGDGERQHIALIVYALHFLEWGVPYGA